MKPLVFDIFCGLGGWSEAFIAEGYRAIGFDVETHNYGNGCYPGELVIQDVRSLSGAEMVQKYGVPAVIVASPPCQEFSYMAMPWGKAKEKQRKILADPVEQARLTYLFNQCFRIQREISESAGHHVPMVVENVRGAQKWVGRSFYLWGDVPALMPIPNKLRMKSNLDCSPRKFADRIATTPEEAHALHYRLPNEGNKTVGMNWSDQSKRGQDFTRIGGQQADAGRGARFEAAEGQKGFRRNSRFNRATGQIILGGIGDASDYSSKSSARKCASAEIAKIPRSLAAWIAKIFKPQK